VVVVSVISGARATAPASSAATDAGQTHGLEAHDPRRGNQCQDDEQHQASFHHDLEHTSTSTSTSVSSGAAKNLEISRLAAYWPVPIHAVTLLAYIVIT